MGALVETMSLFHFVRAFCLCLLFVFQNCIAITPNVGQIYPGFQGSQKDWIDYDGQFLQSNNSEFVLRFFPALDSALFVLVVFHGRSNKAVWTANRGLLVRNSDKFVFDKNGNVYLESEERKVWSTNTEGEKVTAMELQDNGNLVLLGENRRNLWQSFSHPTDTLLSGQDFKEGMQLKSFPKSDKLVHIFEIKSGNAVLSAGFRTPQVYWSMEKESRKTIKSGGSKVYSASLVSNSWNFYGKNGALIWQFNFSEKSDPNATWAAILGSDGAITFSNLQSAKLDSIESIKIPQNSCGLPERCNPYEVCSFDGQCLCPPALLNHSCGPQGVPACNNSKLLYIGERLNYFAIGFVTPFLKSDLSGCRKACLRNCSCVVLFFESASRNCFLFDQVGNLQRADWKSSGFVSFIKVSSNGSALDRGQEQHSNGRKHILLAVFITVATVLAVSGLLYLGFWYYQINKRLLESSPDASEEDNFFESFSGMPVRFSFNDLSTATNDFSVKLGQGGFGSVYQGMLPDGTQVAVKKLEGIGQGKKEFRAEVSIIGSIHHMHLVKLRGFCAEGSHRLLVYEYMGKGSLDRWIFDKNECGHMLDWETRFNIALGMAKGLAYLHEECNVKIVHCDIKPENVLLDDNYIAKVSDFGLAKLMYREQSHVFTTLRGTRGYLAPEWITNYAISEKSDVYSFGIVLLEIIAGRKNYDLEEKSEKAHLPSYAFKMMEEGQMKEIIDSKLNIDENDERVVTAIKVALWCIQDDMHSRPSMTKVLQMLEGLCDVPKPPTSFQLASRLFSSFFKWSSEGGSLSAPMDYNSDALLSGIQLSGPR